MDIKKQSNNTSTKQETNMLLITEAAAGTAKGAVHGLEIEYVKLASLSPSTLFLDLLF